MALIQMRRGTAAQWTSANPVLAAGELGVETDTSKIKAGNGIADWATLPYASGGGGSVDTSTLVSTTNTNQTVDGIKTFVKPVVVATATASNHAVTKAQLDAAAAVTGSVTTAGITDASSIGRSVVRAADGPAIRTLTGSLGASDVTGFALKSGSITQFLDVDATNPPADGEIPTWDAVNNWYTPSSLTGQFAALGSDGRIVSSAQPRWYLPTIVVDEGTPPPSTFPTGGVVFSRPTAPSLVPTAAGANTGSGPAALTVTTTQAFAIGDLMGVFIGTSGEVSAGTTLPVSYTITFSAGAGTVTAATESHQTGSAQVNIQHVRVTTAIPSGSTVTLTASQNRVILDAQLIKFTNVVTTSALDVVATSSGGGTSSLNLSVGPTGATAQASEIAVSAFVQNSGTGTATRTIAGTNGWNLLATTTGVSTSGTSARSLYLFYNVLTTAAAVTATAQVSSTDGSQGAWAGAVATWRGA